MRQSFALLVVRRFEPNPKPSCWWRGRVMALGAEQGGGDLWSRDGRIELLDYHRSLVGKQMLVRGAASCGCQRGGELWIFLPAQSLQFLFLQVEEQPTVVKGSNSEGGPLAVDEARWRESRGNDKLQAGKARERHHQPLNTMHHRDVERVQHSSTNLELLRGAARKCNGGLRRGLASSPTTRHSSLAPGGGIRSWPMAHHSMSEGTALNLGMVPTTNNPLSLFRPC